VSKHTPGPWSLKTYTYFSGGTEQGDVVDPDGRTIRVCGFSLTSTPESKANARLIAAAPDLLEVLREILQDGMHCDVVPHLHAKALAAIAKATKEQA
jgi:hypothetical protein